MNLGNDLWQLDPSFVFLNHGSLGACPRPVLDAQARWREQMEARPVQFLLRDLQDRVAAVRAELGALVHANPDDLALVTNTTTAVNTVLRSIDFRPGDEILTTDHEYNACLNAVDVVAQRTGARPVQVPIAVPVRDPRNIVDAIMSAVTPRTRLALVSHITSATGIVFPIEEIVRELDARGVDVLVDGAHAPALVPLDLDSLGAAYYGATCHKWLCSPKGTGFLHVRRDRQRSIRPLVISHGTNDDSAHLSLFRKEFNWQGTDDPSGFLALPVAIATLKDLMSGGLPALRSRNHELVLLAAAMLRDVLETEPLAPPDMTSAMTAVFVDHRFGDQESRSALERSLHETSRIEVPIMRCRLGRPRQERWLIRVSCQHYNEPSDIECLEAALRGALGM